MRFFEKTESYLYYLNDFVIPCFYKIKRCLKFNPLPQYVWID